MIVEEVDFSMVEVEDLIAIRNPAYVTGQKGRVVSWNEEFERLTNFRFSEIDDIPCNNLFDCKKRKGDGNYIQVCQSNCEFRTGTDIGTATVLREIWIKSKLVTGKDIRRFVDIYIFPFKSNNDKYALHILIDKGGRHDNEYFEKDLVKGLVDGEYKRSADEEDVWDIRNPAYVTRKDGCMVSWNEELERLTNFKPSEIDHNICCELFKSYQEQSEKCVDVCKPKCIFGTPTGINNAQVLRNIWIKSKSVREENIRRFVDIYIFPFNKYVLHILIDRGRIKRK